MDKKVVVIGAGFAGLSVACFLRRSGFSVTVVEAHSAPGGRAGQLTLNDTFLFDKGPSWYWMPGVFERFFGQFGKRPDDYYELVRIEPSYRIYWEDNTLWDVEADYNALREMIEAEEKGAAKKLDAMLRRAKKKYELSMEEGLVCLSGLKWTELCHPLVWKNIGKISVFSSVRDYIERRFQSEKIRRWLEFPTLFLGAPSRRMPALYTMMNYADISLGTWYPKGGMYKIVEAMYALAKELGVRFAFDTPVEKIAIEKGVATGTLARNGSFYEADVVVSGADYHHTEKNLIPEAYKNYSEAYWEKRSLSPSAILYYIGLDKKLRDVRHHNLFFDENFDDFSDKLYKRDAIGWSKTPLFYLNVPSQTDNSLAPAGCETLFILMPVAAGLEGDAPEKREYYFNLIMERIERRIGEPVRPHIVCSHSFGVKDFENEYNSYKGNAYGLANTLLQTAYGKPKCRNKKIPNLFYAGQLTVPGPGVPPALISGEIAARLICKEYGR